MTAGVLVALLLALGLLAQWWIGRESLRLQLQQQAQDALGLPVQVQALRLAWWKGPALQVSDLAVQTRKPLQLQTLQLRPNWSALLQGQLRLDAVLLRQASLPWAGVQALVGRLGQRGGPGADEAVALLALPRQLLLQELRLIDEQGQPYVFDAQIWLADDAWPERLELHLVQGRLQGSRLQLQRLESRRWQLQLAVAGGTVQGTIDWSWPQRAGADHVLKGQLQTRGVELAQLTAREATPAAWAQQPLAGRLEAQTTLQARARQPGGLLDALQTQSRFTVQGAVLRGVDLIKAVQTVGVSRGGQTPLDTLAGQLNTRGKTVELHNLVASSGALSATGQVQISERQELSGRVQVSLGGAVGVPLRVGGTVQEPEVALTAGAKIGAAIGTLLMPGVGTGAGASVGGKLGELLGK